MANFMQGMSAASSFLDIISLALGARQQSNQLRAAAAADQYNAAVDRQQAESTRLIYGQREDQVRRMTAAQLGKQRAAAAESGLTGGSSDDLERQSSIAAELDALNIRYEGEIQAQGYLSQARLADWNAADNRSSARSARTAGYIGIGARSLSGVGDYYRKQTPLVPAKT